MSDGLNRRGFLAGTAGLGTLALAGPLAGRAAAEAAAPVDLSEWFANTDDVAMVDWRGERAVTVGVGTAANGGAFGFGPALTRVDPGTTVVWEWVGSKVYDVADSAGRFASPEASGAGQRYAVRFDGDGLSTYECTEYGPLGMRGAVLVGAGPGNRVSPLTATVLNGVTLLGAGALGYGVYSHVQESRPRDGRDRGPAV